MLAVFAIIFLFHNYQNVYWVLWVYIKEFVKLHSIISLCSFWRVRYRKQDRRKILWKHVLSLQSLSSITFSHHYVPCWSLGSLMLLVMATLVFRTSNKVSEMLGNVNTSNALSAFEKMEEKGETFRLSESSLNPCIAHFELKKKKKNYNLGFFCIWPLLLPRPLKELSFNSVNLFPLKIEKIKLYYMQKMLLGLESNHSSF